MLKKITILLIFLLSIQPIFASENIRWLKDPMIWFMEFNYFLFLILFTFSVIYFFYDKKKKKKKLKKIKWPSLTKLLLNSLKKLQKNSEKMDKSVFYFEFNTCFRKYFSILGLENSNTLTLRDIEVSKIDKTIISLFKKSYLLEFNNKKDTNKLRLELIDSLIKIIK